MGRTRRVTWGTLVGWVMVGGVEGAVVGVGAGVVVGAALVVGGVGAVAAGLALVDLEP